MKQKHVCGFESVSIVYGLKSFGNEVGSLACLNKVLEFGKICSWRMEKVNFVVQEALLFNDQSTDG
jgi:hypothetical protein